MRIDEKTHAAVPAINGEQILQMTPGIGKIAEIEFLNFSNIPGPHMTPEKMFELSKTINHKLEVEGFDGAVVTHGTDSLEETALSPARLHNPHNDQFIQHRTDRVPAHPKHILQFVF